MSTLLILTALLLVECVLALLAGVLGRAAARRFAAKYYGGAR